jgi:hypothetical protein
MHMYTYHTYGKDGNQISTDYKNLKTLINNNQIQIGITEHNCYTSSSWDTKETTTDDPSQASRLASQIINFIASGVHTQIIFKFSITSSFSANRQIAKNGLHWGEISQEPFHLSDTTLAAESVRLLSKMKQSNIYSLVTNDTSKFRKYLVSKNNNKESDYWYIYAVNDKSESVQLLINITELNVPENNEIIIEQVGSKYKGEISEILKSNNQIIKTNLNQFTTLRLMISTKKQEKNSLKATLSCTVKAGKLSDQSQCLNSSLTVGTSQTQQHENTNVMILDFILDSFRKNQKTILKLISNKTIGSEDTNLLVLGIPVNNKNTIRWNDLSTILNKLDSNLTIDSISKNFINWSEKNISVVGHLTVEKLNSANMIHMLDITDYIEKISISNDLNSKIRLLIYRPYRHPEYQTTAGKILADNLSKGSLAAFNSPELIQYYHTNTMSNLDRKSLESLVFTQKNIINLSNIGISSIEKKTFEKLNKLEELNLNSNKIQHLDDFLFSDLTSLKRLYLQNNELLELGIVFRNLIHLEWLKLDNNKLTKIELELNELKSLKYLGLESNKLVSINSKAFQGLNNLELVCLWQNPISVILNESIQNICDLNIKCQVNLNTCNHYNNDII